MTENVKLGDWTLKVYPGREVGVLPAAAPEVVLYRGRIDERKDIEVSDDRLTPWDADFAEVLRAAIVEQARRNEKEAHTTKPRD
jgi:hypothetical protein